MDHETKVALKQDVLVTSAETGIAWAGSHRKQLYVTIGAVLAAILLVVAGVVVYNQQALAASEAFGAGMQIYQAPIAQPSQPLPVELKTYNSVAERAQVAHEKFAEAADKYGYTPDGRNALYFAGLTAMEAGQTKTAEDTLTKVANGWDKNLAALAKLALAQLYRQTGSDAKAIDIYNQLTDKPTDTVPAGLAQLQLAELYEGEGKQDLAKKIYAQLKDKDAKGAAGTIAAQKLNPTAKAGPSGPVGR